LGAILLAYAALRRLGAALANISGAWIACHRVVDLIRASTRRAPSGDPTLAVQTAITPTRRLLEMRDIGFRYPRRAAAALRHVSYTINSGDRVLLEGRSGSGKSTWVGVATGLRAPDSGLLFLKGIDRHTTGDREWRKRVAASPQFHENHIFSESLAFNLLMGRAWPPRPEDLADAEAVCRELGLGSLLDRMPLGMMQMVGETGWQLSHGERARVYLARTLLQGADLIVLDETLGALDPATAHQALECVLRRAPALVCVTHP
jgi:ATP-binding cassette subfamily B protein